MQSFNHGPFSFTPGTALRVAGEARRRWTMSYGTDELAELTALADAAQGAIIEAFGQARADFIARTRDEHAPARIALIDFESGYEIAHMISDDMCGMTPGLIDDRSRYWIRSADRRYSRSVSLTQFAQLAAEHAAPDHAWIAGLLPDDVLTRDPSDWRAPSAWEIRHVVGEGGLIGLSGAKAAALVGISPQNFRKYTAADGAAARQNMSFAAWHLLLHKLGVKRA